MLDFPDKRYFQALSDKTGFIRDTLEKSYRLIGLLEAVDEDRRARSLLALKGGTALHFVHLGLRRLSIDIDLNYIGSTLLDETTRDRESIRDWWNQVFTDQRYTVTEHNSVHALEQFILSYQNAAGNTDYLKVEVNYSERLPALPTERMPVKHPFSGLRELQVLAYQPEENFAMKMRALLSRGTPRDLYDVWIISNGARPFDLELFRELTIFYSILAPEDLRVERDYGFTSLTDLDLRRHLVPLLSKSAELPPLAAMKKRAGRLAKQVMTFSKEERQFLDTFYGERRFARDLLFNQSAVSQNLGEHPMVRWRLQKMS